jgi:[ribosomal protein S18]-alanine N-acetyltransferase
MVQAVCPTPPVAGPFEPRALAAADLPAIMAIEVQAYSHPWSEGNFADSLRAGYFAQVWCNRAGDMLGYCVAMAGVGELHLLNITVAPQHQSQGWGRVLLAAVQAHGRQLGLAQLLLEVRHSNQAAQRLYTRLGFAQVGLRRAYYPAGNKREDAVVMSVPLASAQPCAPTPAQP